MIHAVYSNDEFGQILVGIAVNFNKIILTLDLDGFVAFIWEMLMFGGRQYMQWIIYPLLLLRMNPFRHLGFDIEISIGPGMALLLFLDFDEKELPAF